MWVSVAASFMYSEKRVWHCAVDATSCLKRRRGRCQRRALFKKAANRIRDIFVRLGALRYKPQRDSVRLDLRSHCNIRRNYDPAHSKSPRILCVKLVPSNMNMGVLAAVYS